MTRSGVPSLFLPPPGEGGRDQRNSLPSARIADRGYPSLLMSPEFLVPGVADRGHSSLLKYPEFLVPG